MRRTSRGVLAIDLALSLSYCPSTGLTYALLLGHSDLQAAFIQQQIKELAQLASHPALLPTLVCTYLRTLLQRLADQAFNNLLNVEAESGQSVFSVYSEFGPRPLENRSDADNSKYALGVIQLVTAWENYTKGLLFDIESVQNFIGYINSIAPSAQRAPVEMQGLVLNERLRFLAQKGNSVLWRVQFIKERAQAQLTAVD
jgi:hypothetical protein